MLATLSVKPPAAEAVITADSVLKHFEILFDDESNRGRSLISEGADSLGSIPGAGTGLLTDEVPGLEAADPIDLLGGGSTPLVRSARTADPEIADKVKALGKTPFDID